MQINAGKMISIDPVKVIFVGEVDGVVGGVVVGVQPKSYPAFVMYSSAKAKLKL